MAIGTLFADLKVNFLFNVKFHNTDKVKDIKYDGQYSNLITSKMKVNDNA